MQRSSTLGLIVPDTYNPYFAEVARGVEHVAFQHGYTVMLCHSGYDVEREVHYVDVLREHMVAGVIWIPATSNPESIRKLTEYGIPAVVLDRQVTWGQVVSVTVDNFRGGYLATKHLIDLGHRNIGCIARPVELTHSQQRVEGYRTALQEHGLPIVSELVARGGLRLENGRDATNVLLDLPNPPTAIFTYNDAMAIGALRAAYERGLRVPNDISIVGFDDIPQAAFTCPALTTIAQPKFDMGSCGAELLLTMIAKKAAPAGLEKPLEVELIVRESTGPASR
ncbi:MAG: substrate-binding domain-containing protein [candidate division NC10 bacterium]|nr:substrate-binding domain-containing protein [candidate division NC10 bacterium]